MTIGNNNDVDKFLKIATVRQMIVAIGIAFDEQKRTAKKSKRLSQHMERTIKQRSRQ